MHFKSTAQYLMCESGLCDKSLAVNHTEAQIKEHSFLLLPAIAPFTGDTSTDTSEKEWF